MGIFNDIAKEAKRNPLTAAAVVTPMAYGPAVLEQLAGGGGGLSELEGKYLGWDKEHAARKRQREAAAQLGQVPLPEFEQYGDMDLNEYSAVDELANFDPTLGDIYTAGPAATYEAEGYDPTYADFERIGTVNLGDTNLDGINLDPATRDAQMAALGELSGMTTDGFTDAENAQMALINAQAGQQAKGARDALSQQMARRGISGSGLEMMGQQMANQSAAEAMRLQGLQAQQMAQQRKMEALAGMSDLSTAVRGQDYGEQLNRARAQDAIDAWNAANTQGVMGKNAANYNTNQALNAGIANDAGRFEASAQNAANQYNTGAMNAMSQFNAGQQQAGSFANAGIQNQYGWNKAGAMQDIANANTGIQNQEAQWNQVGKNEANNALAQQGFGNQMSKATGQYNAQNQIAGRELDAAKSRRTDTGQIIDYGAKGAAMAFGSPAAATAVPTITSSNASPGGWAGNSVDDEKKKQQLQNMYYA